jgi:hypothetical protein
MPIAFSSSAICVRRDGIKAACARKKEPRRTRIGRCKTCHVIHLRSNKGLHSTIHQQGSVTAVAMMAVGQRGSGGGGGSGSFAAAVAALAWRQGL